ncbi:hypothetical protein GCK72_022965 [Caenorhabditis remanei]|uniref:Uncharacterized protein n=1 Tax=Caenorhabditis remanei TaxID=31234 RepID=A0A6A5FVP6_CAERE|nr:hypothetical protein GCK72_022965 [Caenorhabditis remanei]KAF1746509.1 hypothetical protein GCK72_022965 [Caenorhabditis remanei]
MKSFENGKVRVKCGRFDGHVRKVSEAVTGCYFNGTVHKLGEVWTEPNSNGLEETSAVNKTMFCSKSAEGYFQSKLIGCSRTHIRNYTYGVRFFETTDRIQLNSTNEVSPYLMCTEDTPGGVQLVNVNEKKEAGCLIDNVWHKGSEPWIDEQRGAVFECHSYSQYRKKECLIENRRISIDKEVKLSNGCTLLCHPQANIYKCNTPLINFEVAGKVQKSNH